MELPNKVQLMEVGPRGGLQHEPLVNGQPVAVIIKIALIERPAEKSMEAAA